MIDLLEGRASVRKAPALRHPLCSERCADWVDVVITIYFGMIISVQLYNYHHCCSVHVYYMNYTDSTQAAATTTMQR